MERGAEDKKNKIHMTIEQVSNNNAHLHDDNNIAAAAAANNDLPPNAADRTFADIDFATYITTTFFVCALRSAALHPIYMIVTRKQVCSETGKRSFLDIARQMRKEEGGSLRAFSQGLYVIAAGAAISESLFNGVYEYGRYALQEDLGLHLTSSTATAAWMADWSSRVLYSPFSVVAVRQITFNCPAVTHHTAKFEHSGTMHVVRESYRCAGVRTFFSGIGLSLCVGSFTSSIFFAAYVNSKKVLYGAFGPWLAEKERRRKQHDITGNRNDDGVSSSSSFLGVPQFASEALYSSTDNFILNSASSVVGSAMASVVVNPYYVLLGRVQSGVAKTAREAAVGVMHLHGWRGFFRGAVACTAATMFDAWLASSTYEFAMHVGVGSAKSS